MRPRATGDAMPQTFFEYLDRILVPCRISCSANSPCPAIRDGPTRTRIFTTVCLLVDAEVLPLLSLLGSAVPNISAPLGRRTAFPGGVDAVRGSVTADYGCPLTGYC